VDFINKAKQKAQHVELYQVRATETPVRYENNKLKTIDTSERKVNALRVVKDGKLGFATSTGADLDQLLDMALATAEFGRPWDAELPGPAELSQVELEHSSTEVDLDTLVATGAETIRQIRECHPEILASARLSTRKSTVRLVNSQGFSGEYSKSMFSMLGMADLTEGKNMLSMYAGFSSGKLEKQVEKTVQRLVANFQHGRTNVPIQSGNYTVIFSPFCMGDILRPLLACADGKAVEKGFSPWKNKLGEKLFSPQFSLYDDATLPFAPASCSFDGEGVAARRTAIIRDGKVNSFILDLATAQALGMNPTGNGFRSQPDSLPGPGYSNIVLELAETQPLEQLIGSVQRGVIIHSLMGAWAGNPYSGQVSGNIDLGFLIEDGQIKGRVKDCMVSVDCFRAFREQIAGASTEKEWAWNMLLPHLVLSDVAINAKG
jgi:PmbA protein